MYSHVLMYSFLSYQSNRFHKLNLEIHRIPQVLIRHHKEPILADVSHSDVIQDPMNVILQLPVISPSLSDLVVMG